MSKTQIALPPNALQAYRDAYGRVFDPKTDGCKNLDAHRAGLLAVLALPREPATCGEVGDLIKRLRGWPFVQNDLLADLLNEAAAALELITTVADGKSEIEALREEVGFWRRDLAARLWMSTALLKDALSRRDESMITALHARISADLAAFKDAEAAEWHDTCDLCGEPVRPGQPRGGNDDVSGHLRCIAEGHENDLDGPDDTESKLARDVEAARKAIAMIEDFGLPADEQARRDAVMVKAQQQGYRVTFKHSTVPGTFQGPYAMVKHLRTGQETPFTGIAARTPLEQVEAYLDGKHPSGQIMDRRRL